MTSPGAGLLRRGLDEVDERPERRWHETLLGGVEKRPGEGQPPGIEDTALQVRTQPVLEEVDDAATGDRRVDGKVGRPSAPDDQRPCRLDLDDLVILLELPLRHRPEWETAAQTGMVE